MTTQSLPSLLQTHPFRPFDINLADGDSVRVEHPEFAARSPGGRTLVVFTPDDRMKIVDLPLVSSLQPLNPSPRPRRKKRH